MFVYIRSAAFVIVVTQKLVLQQSKNVTAKCTETLSPPPSIQYLLALNETPEFPFWGYNICVDFYLRNSKKNGEYEETK